MQRMAKGMAAAGLAVTLLASGSVQPAGGAPAAKGCVSEREYRNKIERDMSIAEVQKNVGTLGIKRPPWTPRLRGRDFLNCGYASISKHYSYVLWHKTDEGWRSFRKGSVDYRQPRADWHESAQLWLGFPRGG